MDQIHLRINQWSVTWTVPNAHHQGSGETGFQTNPIFPSVFGVSWKIALAKISRGYPFQVRDNFFPIILKYLLPAVCIDSMDNLKDLYGVRFIFFIVKSLAISLQRFHISYKLRCEILQNIKSLDSSDGRAIGYNTLG